MKTIKIQIGEEFFETELNNSSRANKLNKILQFEGNATLQGKEVYFTIPFHHEEEPDAREILQPDELAYWSVGSAFVIFFGLTLVSRDDRPRANSNVNVFGRQW